MGDRYEFFQRFKDLGEEPRWQRDLRKMAEQHDLLPELVTRGGPRIGTKDGKSQQKKYRQPKAGATEQIVLQHTDKSTAFPVLSPSRSISIVSKGDETEGVGVRQWRADLSSLTKTMDESNAGNLSVKERRRKQGKQPKQARCSRVFTDLKGLEELSWIEVACAENHMLALDMHGAVWSWGHSSLGRLGYGTVKLTEASPIKVRGFPSSTKIITISVGADFSAAISDQGDLFTWGCGDDGKLGLGSYRTQNRAKKVWTLRLQHQLAKQVSCGKSHMVILTVAGKVYTAGEGSFGRLGLGQTGSNFARFRPGGTGSSSTESKCDWLDQWEPQLVPSLSSREFQWVSAGRKHTLVVTKGGRLLTCGYGRGGALGHGVKKHEWTFRTVEALWDQNVVQATGGGLHSAAITENGQLFTWGTALHGRLGHGSSIDIEWSPRQVTAFKELHVTSVSCGRNHTAVIVLDQSHLPGGGESLHMFGDDKHGQLGHHNFDGFRLNGKVLTRSQAELKRFGKDTPVRHIQFSDQAIKHVATSSVGPMTAIVLAPITNEPETLFVFLTQLKIPPDRALAYHDKLEAFAYTSVRSLATATFGALVYILGSTTYSQQYVRADCQTIHTALNTSWRKPCRIPGKVMACGNVIFQDDYAQLEDCQEIPLAAFEQTDEFALSDTSSEGSLDSIENFESFSLDCPEGYSELGQLPGPGQALEDASKELQETQQPPSDDDRQIDEGPSGDDDGNEADAAACRFSSILTSEAVQALDESSRKMRQRNLIRGLMQGKAPPLPESLDIESDPVESSERLTRMLRTRRRTRANRNKRLSSSSYASTRAATNTTRARGRTGTRGR